MVEDRGMLHTSSSIALFKNPKNTKGKSRKFNPYNCPNTKTENFNLTKQLNSAGENLTRTDKIKNKLAEQNKPTNVIIFNQANITYFTNFSGAVALFIPEQGENVLYVSEVNYQQAKAEALNTTVKLLKRGENVADIVAKQFNFSKLGVDTISFENWHALAKAVNGEAKLEAINNVIGSLRKVKETQEIQLIKQACKFAEIGIKTAKEIICPGLKEKEVAAEVEYAMRKAGSDGLAFNTIVASGYSSSFPHGTFMERTIQEGDFVVVDLGASKRFYHSDITRTFIAGKPTEKQLKILEIVKLAQQKAIEAIQPKILAKEIDLIARKIIEETGYIEFFVHNLGHGVGLEVHESPILSPNSRDILEVGNVVTVEPGIYLEGFGGVRIEDTVHITKKGAEKLTSAPYTP